LSIFTPLLFLTHAGFSWLGLAKMQADRQPAQLQRGFQAAFGDWDIKFWRGNRSDGGVRSSLYSACRDTLGTLVMKSAVGDSSNIWSSAWFCQTQSAKLHMYRPQASISTRNSHCHMLLR